jgi:hypothetical protein
MATYYVRKTGSDAAAGTSAGTAWLTIGKALGASGIASGDTVYIGAGVYRESVTVAMTSATAETLVIGDVDGKQTGDSGQVIWTAWTTDDKTAPAASDTLNLSGRDYLTFKNIRFVENMTSGSCVDALSQTSTNITFQNCMFLSGGTNANHALIQITAANNVALNWTIDRCYFNTFSGNQYCLVITCVTGASSWDINCLMKNSVVLGTFNACVRITSSGTSSGEGNGLDIVNCTIFGSVETAGTRVSLTYPSTVRNSVVYAIGGVCLNAGESGALTETYNVLVGATARTNVTAGTGSVTTAYAPDFWTGLETCMFGVFPRTAMGPLTYNGPFMAFGDDGTALTEDFTGRPKPAGGRSATRAIGAFEFHDCATKETGTVRTGSNALRIKGPGVHEFWLPVDAAEITVSIYTRWDATYAGTKPSMSILYGGESGVTDATDTATGSSGAWEQLAITFTPSSAGVVVVRLTSSDTNGAGETYWDDFDVA